MPAGMPVALGGGGRSIGAGPGRGANEAGSRVGRRTCLSAAVKEPAQPGEQRSIAGPQRRAGHLAAKDGDLVAKHDDLDGQFVAVTPQEPDQLEDRTKAR